MMKFHKIFLLGAGAIGNFYGALLSKKSDVTLLGEREHIKKINSEGLKVKIGEKEEIFKIKGKEKIENIPPKTLILLTTKVHQSTGAIKSIKNLIRKDTIILILQNGLGNEDLVKRIIGKKCKVERGIVYSASEFLKPGKIKVWPKKTILPLNKIGKEIAEIFKEAGLMVELTKEIKKEIWKKLVVNCVLGPLAALFKIRNNEVASMPLKRVRELLIKECLEAARAEGININGNFKKEFEEKISTYTNYPSMCQDIMKGKKTEIDFLNGKIIELAKKHKIQTPANEVIYYLIKFLELSNHASPPPI